MARAWISPADGDMFRLMPVITSIATRRCSLPGIAASALSSIVLIAAPSIREESSPLSYPQWKEAIVSYAVDVEVQANTDLVIAELITWNSGTENIRHGLIRDIPTVDYLNNGLQRAYEVELLSISRDGEQVPYTVDDSGGMLSVRIGDEDVEISGLHEFAITYVVRNGLDVIRAEDLDSNAPPEVAPGDVELYWDFIGEQWGFPIYEGRVSIIGPGPATAARCYAAPTYIDGCVVDLNGGPGGATTMIATSLMPPM